MKLLVQGIVGDYLQNEVNSPLEVKSQVESREKARALFSRTNEKVGADRQQRDNKDELPS
jgi:hypothetical protein